MDPTVYYPQQTASNSSYTVAVIALILAIIAIVIIVAIAVIFYRDSSTISGIVKNWTLESAVPSTNPYPFTAGPNTILELPSGPTVNYVVNITPYTGIDTIVTGGNTSIFQISNTQGDNDVKVTFTGGTLQPWTNANDVTTITKGTTAEYVWITPVIIQRLR